MLEIMYYVHGSTADNETHAASGWDQVSLSQKGIEETQEVAGIIDSDRFEAIFTSDLLRAIQSAEILFSNRKNDIVVDQRLRECNYGSSTKKTNLHLQYREHINNPFPNGESLHDVEFRMRRFLNGISLKGLNKIAIVSHRVPQLALEVITGISWQEAIERDWRICGKFQPGWLYIY